MMSTDTQQVQEVETTTTTTTTQRRHRRRRTTRRRKRVVKFNEMVKVLEVEKLEDCCDDDDDDYKPSDCFYTKSDYARIRSDIKQSLHMMKSSSSELSSDELDDDSDSLSFTRRGLEVRTPEGAKQRRQNKDAAWVALFDEQDKQWDNGVHYPDLSKVYQKETKRCAIEALLQGLQDHSVATRIMNEDYEDIIENMPLMGTISSSPLKATTTSCGEDVLHHHHHPNNICSPLRDDTNFVSFTRRKSITAFAA